MGIMYILNDYSLNLIVFRNNDFFDSLLVIAAAGLFSYILGLFISFFRWYLYIGRESFSDLILGKTSNKILQAIKLNEDIREITLRKLIADLKKLNILSEREFSVEKTDSIINYAIKNKYDKLIDFSYFILIENMREADTSLYAYYDRWDDIYASRRNLLISLQLITILLYFKSFPYTFSEWSTMLFLSIGLIVINLFLYLCTLRSYQRHVTCT